MLYKEDMDFHELATKRRSVRRFKSDPVEEEKLIKVLRCALAAPSAGNIQPYEIVVVRRKATRTAIAEAALGQQFLAHAPVVLIFLQDSQRSAATYGSRGTDLYATQDTAIACAYAQLAAADLGLGACWVGAFYPETVARLIAAPRHLVPVALLVLGYTDEQPKATGRRPAEDMVKRESY